MPQPRSISISIEDTEQQALLRIIESVLAWSELPLYEHEYQALRAILTKLDQGGRGA